KEICEEGTPLRRIELDPVLRVEAIDGRVAVAIRICSVPVILRPPDLRGDELVNRIDPSRQPDEVHALRRRSMDPSIRVSGREGRALNVYSSLLPQVRGCDAQ